MSTRFPGWLVRALLMAFFTLAPVHAARPMVSYRALELGAGNAELGILAGAYAALSFLSAVPLGRVIDRRGASWFLAAGVGILLGSALLLSAAPSLATLAVANALLGFGQVMALVALQTLLSNSGRVDRRDERIAAFTVAGALGQMGGPAAAGALLARTGSLGTVFLATAALASCALILALSLLARPAPPPEHEDGPRSDPGSMRQELATVLRCPSVPHALLASVAVLTTIDLVIAYLPAFGEARGIPPETVGLLLALQAAGAVTSRLFMVRLIRGFGRRRLIVAAMAAPAIVLATLPITDPVVLLFPLLAIAGFGLGLGQPLTLSWVVGEVPQQLRGTAIGTRLMTNRGGQFILPITVGSLAGGAGVSAILLTTAGLLATSAVVVRSAPAGSR